MPGSTVNQSYLQEPYVNGRSPYRWSISSGRLPAGLQLDTGSGSIHGRTTTAGAYSFTLKVVDSRGRTGAKQYTISVAGDDAAPAPAPPSISTSSLASGQTGKTYSQALAVSGGTTPYAWSVSSGALPPGLALASGTGVIAGTPTTAGTSTFTVRVADSASAAATRALSIAVAAPDPAPNPAPGPLSVQTSSLPGGKAGTAYTSTLSAAGGVTPYAWSVSAGALPGGLNLAASTGALSGTPTTAGTFNFTARVTDDAGTSANRALSVTIAAADTPLSIPTTSLPEARTGSAYSQTLSATGGSTPYSWSVSQGSLPEGLTLASGTGAISGTPSNAGTSNFTARVTDSAGDTATRALSITVASVNNNPPASVSVNITSPAANAAVSGALNLAVNTSSMPTEGNVQYLLNGKPLTGPIYTPPYSHAWHSALSWDGPKTLQAIVRDAQGREIGRSAVVPFRVANGSATISLRTPASTINSTVSGILNYEAQINSPTGQEAWMFGLNGVPNPDFSSSNTNSMSVDTRRLRNGPHELFVATYAPPSGDYRPLGMLQHVVNVDNGRTVQGIRTRWQDMYMSPGQTDSLAPRTIYTDGSSEAVASGVTYRSGNTNVATVSSTGVVTARAGGITDVTATWNGHTAKTRVFVTAVNGLPHFAKDGAILNQYTPGRSMFVRTLFSLNSDALRETPNLGERLVESGVNAISNGVYVNPIYANQSNLANWKTGYDDWWNSIVTQAERYDLSILLTGDDIARNAEELGDTLFNSWSPDALRHALTRARDSKRAVAIEMVDEVTFMWGETPKPTDGRWRDFTPSIPDDGFVRLMNIMNGVSGRTPVSWPIGGLSGHEDAANWMGDPTMAEYNTFLWTFMDWRNLYPTYPSLYQYKSNMDLVMVDRMPFVQRDKPVMLQGSVTGPFYTKLAAANEYQPGVDLLQNQWTPPSAAAAQVMYAAAMGAAGIRVYTFDAESTKNDRERRPIGDGDTETGTEPFRIGTDRWTAMASAFNLVKTLEPHLLQKRLSAPNLGTYFATGARQGPNSRLLITVNHSETASTETVELSPYLYSGGTVIRYRLTGATLKVEAASPSQSETVTFAPGESVAWLFQPSGAAAPSPVAFTRPLADATVSGSVRLEVSVADPSTVSGVDFLVNGERVGSVSSGPYAVTWNTSSVTSGVWHSVVARVTSQNGSVSEARTSLFVK